MAGLLACTLFCIAPAGVKAAAADLSLRDVWTDTGLYFTAPLRWNTEDWMFFGGAVAAIAAAHEADGRIRNHFAGASPVLDGKDTNSIRDAIPGLAAVVGTWAFAQLGDSSDGRLEAYTMLEAAGLSSITSYGLKFAAGRRRPDETLHVDDWRAGGNSFPSLHASAAFSIGTVLAESGSDDLRWVRRLLGYGIATGTAYLRLKGNAHWFSDTVAGGAIGIATAEFTMNRREARKRSWQATVTPAAGGGVLIGFNMTLP
jgi:membrane-associated phospholipid phosphatase